MDEESVQLYSNETQQQDEVYVFVKFLGQGSFGKVNLYRNTTDNSLVVWKEIDLKKLDTKMRNEAFAEVEILSMLDHANIIKYFKHFIGDDILYIELQYAKAGTLTHLIKEQKLTEKYFDQDSVLWYLYQLCNAVDYIHEVGIMHRDIKALNIFLMQSNLLKLGDFGIAKILDPNNGLLETQVGTPFYMSPEIIEGKKYSIKSDIWALGCVAYEIITLSKVFDATNQLKLAMKISTCNVDEIEIDQYSADLKELIKKILSKEPAQRPSAREILNHELFSSRASDYNARIEILNTNSKKNRTVSGLPISESNVSLNRQNTSSPVSNTFYNQNMQAPIIESKLSEVYVWGSGKQLPKNVEFFNKDNAPLHVAAGSSHFAVINAEKELYTWSASNGGSTSTNAKLGHGNIFTRKPKRVEAFRTNGISIEQVSIGDEMTCCVSEDGELYVFGTNYYGCLGIKASNVEPSNQDEENNQDESNNVYNPVRVPFFHENNLKVVKVSCGDSHVIVLTNTNQIFTWGCGECGRLGLGDEQDRSEPNEVKFKFKYVFKNVFAGADCSFVLTKEGRVLTFGNNDYNKLCLNINPIGFKSATSQKCIKETVVINYQLTPTIIKQLSGYNIYKVCPGLNHTAVIDDFGRLFTFGSNKFGQLGVGDYKIHSGLNLVAGPLVGFHVTNAACGDTFTVCSTSENHIFSWGNRKDGRLGLGSTFDDGNSICLPKTIFGSLHLVSDMSARYWHSIIIAEQVLNTKPVRSVSYADYMKKSNMSLEYESDGTNLVRSPSGLLPEQNINYDLLINVSENENEVYFNSSTQDCRLVDKKNLLHRPFTSPKEEETDMPEWLKKDIEEADFIPIEVLERREAFKGAQYKSNSKDDNLNDSFSDIKNIKNLEEALEIIKSLRVENLKLKEDNKGLTEKISNLENKQ